MKIHRTDSDRSHRRGMVTVVFIALLAIMLILATVESSALIRLRRETRLLEKQQIKRLTLSQTNAVVVLQPPSQ